MRKQHKAPDRDEVNDNKIHKEEFGAEVKLNEAKFKHGDLVEYRYCADESTWKPAVVSDNSGHNVHGHVIYKVFSTLYGYREVHESVLYPIEGIDYNATE